MDNFNKELIRNIKLFHSKNEEEIFDEKYSFLKYVFKNLEAIEDDCLEVCEEEFLELEANIDGYYYDEDSSTYNLYLVVYNDKNDDNSFLDKEEIEKHYNKIINFAKKVVSGKYIEFDDSSVTYGIAESIHRNIKNAEFVVNMKR